MSQDQQEHGIDLMIMGAYGHSRIRHLLVGSTTTGHVAKVVYPPAPAALGTYSNPFLFWCFIP